MAEKITIAEMKLLINKGIIKKGTIVQILNKDYIDYKIEEILHFNDDEEYVFKLKKLENSDKVMVRQSYITGIEHMNPKRFVEAYSVDDELNTIEINDKTNVSKNVIGKKEASINNIQLKNGMKVILHNDVIKRMNNKPLNVKGVGDSIKLVAPRGRPRKNV